MKQLILTTALLLISCGSLQEKSDELYGLAMICNEREKIPVIENGIVKIENKKIVMHVPKEKCKDEWAAWNQAEEHIIDIERRRALRRGPICPSGKAAYCDHWCMKDKPQERVWMCINDYVFRDMIRY